MEPTGPLLRSARQDDGFLRAAGIDQNSPRGCGSPRSPTRLCVQTSALTTTIRHHTERGPATTAHNARLLSDNGREFCGHPDRHPYDLFLQLVEAEHRTTKVNRPQSNGIVERFNRPLLDEHFRVEGRHT